MKQLFLLIFYLLFFNCLYAQNKAERLDSLFKARLEDSTFNGNVLVAEKGKILFKNSYGVANENTKEPLRTNHIFELASVSKQFTAMAIVLLQKQGKLNYDDPISKYIPELSFYGNITIRNLLHHTGGLPDYISLFSKTWDKTKIANNQDIIAQFATDQPKVLFQPGDKDKYSNTGYALLGSIIERVSNKSYGEFLKENIFKPLKMKNTFVYQSRYQPKKIKNYALGYVEDSLMRKVLPDKFGKAYYTYYLDGIVGDGMVNSTLNDLFKWDRALYTNKLINDKDRQLIFSSIITKDGKDNHYGFGWTVFTPNHYGKIVSHSGGWAGYSTFIDRHLENDKTVIMLQNNMTPITDNPVDAVRNILYNEPVPQKFRLTNANLDKYTGTYSAANFSRKIIVSRKGNTLFGRATGQWSFVLTPYPNHLFKYERAGIEITFQPDEKKMIFIQRGNKTVFSKE